MNHFLFILIFALLQDVPFKSNEEFDIKLDYQFKQRPAADPNTVQLGETSRIQRASTGVLPYLILNIKFLRLPDEKSRVHITNNLGDRPVVKKVNLNTVLQLDLGFTVDMIDRVRAHEYTLTFLNAEKKAVDRVLINIGEDGSFFVNGEKRGRF